MTTTMRTRLKCENPEGIDFTMTITMSAKDWELLRDQLDKSSIGSSYPSWQMKSAINDVLAQARKIYWATDDEGPK